MSLESSSWASFFPATSRHTKAREFIELKQGMMTVLEIVGLLLQDMDSIVRTTFAIEREIDDARSI